MVIGARDLPQARRRRWLYHGALAVAALLAVRWAASGFSDARLAAGAVAASEERLLGKVAEADVVAADCGLRPFSDEGSLESFPVRLPSYPTKREMECARRVSVARAALIDEHLGLRKLRPEAAEASRVARRRAWIAGLTALAWAAGICAAEVLPRLRGSPKGVVR